jgi:hypothetical protein
MMMSVTMIEIRSIGLFLVVNEEKHADCQLAPAGSEVDRGKPASPTSFPHGTCSAQARLPPMSRKMMMTTAITRSR